MREPPECKGCAMPICPINRWHCIVRLDLVLLKDLRKGGVSMDRLKKDLDHIKADGIDSGALYKRVCKYLSELVAYKATELTPETVVHAHWVVDDEYLTCSHCSGSYLAGDTSHEVRELLDRGEAYKRCPHCGAKMDGGDAGGAQGH